MLSCEECKEHISLPDRSYFVLSGRALNSLSMDARTDGASELNMNFRVFMSPEYPKQIKIYCRECWRTMAGAEMTTW